MLSYSKPIMVLDLLPSQWKNPTEMKQGLTEKQESLKEMYPIHEPQNTETVELAQTDLDPFNDIIKTEILKN